MNIAYTVNTAMKHLKKYETNLMAQYRKASKEIEVVATTDGLSKKVRLID
jgi:hypothetical protein